MVNLQDITCQLMKPAKDLANWKFPLSEILEEYYALLEEHCDVNFGEAALILQNSVNIYVRRVERLFDDTKSLNEMFVNHEIANENENSKCDKKSRNKNSINFDDFKLCNLVEEVGKNINTKTRFNVEKPVKLLTRRFAQLENNMDDIAHKNIEIIDIHGDVIGKKYHFRCNQYLNTNGLLIDEPTQDDFGTVDTESSATSGYCSNTSLFDSSCNLENNLDNMCNTLIDNNTETLTNCCLSPVLDNNDCDTISGTENFNVSNSDAINEEEDQAKSVGESIDIQHSSKCNTQFITNHDTNMNSMDNLQNQQNTINCFSNKRFEEFKHTINKKKTINSRIWEPVSLSHNISLKNKDTMHLLKNTSSVMSMTETRKRKIISKLHKNECTVSFLLKESKLQQKDFAHASKKQTFSQFKTEEINELQKVFEDCFKNKEGAESLEHQTSTNIMHGSLEEKSLTSNNTISSDSFFEESDILPTSSSFLDCETESLSPINTFSSTPDNYSLELNSRNSLPNYERLIEHEMKKLFENSDVQTELDRQVNKWHQLIQPKLLEIEKKPIFSIHEYASQIIEKLNNKNHQKVTFDNVVDGECSYDVARYFLALLQLANTYKVDINTEENNDECIEILLLDTGKTV